MSDKWRLRPCPFCGESLRLKMHEFPEDNYIQCQSCSTTGPNGFDQECAVLQWNQREESKLTLAVEALEHIASDRPRCAGCTCPDVSLVEHYTFEARAALEKLRGEK